MAGQVYYMCHINAIATFCGRLQQARQYTMPSGAPPLEPIPLSGTIGAMSYDHGMNHTLIIHHIIHYLIGHYLIDAGAGEA